MIKTNGHVNGGFTNEKAANVENGGHVNGGLTSGNKANGDGMTVASYLNSAFSSSIDPVNMTAVETGNVEGGLVNGQNVVAGVKTGNGTARNVPESAATRRPRAEDSELSLWINYHRIPVKQ